MDLTEEKVSFDQMPQVVSELKQEISGLKTLIHTLIKQKLMSLDYLTDLCNSSDKGVDAGLFMMKLMALKKKRDLSLLIIAHTPKCDLSSSVIANPQKSPSRKCR